MRHIHFFIRVVYINFKMYLKVQDNTFIRRITMGKTEQVEKLNELYGELRVIYRKSTAGRYHRKIR